MVSRARQFVILDTGLFGDLPAAGPHASRLRTALPIAAVLVDTLLRAKSQHPDLAILILTDPSTLQMDNAQLLPLERTEIAKPEVLAVDVARLRAPDPVFRSFWNLCCRWWSSASSSTEWPKPLEVGPPTVSMQLWGELRAYQRSHRQVLIADDGGAGLDALVFSRPLHAEAGIHSATALKISGAALEPLIESEFVLAQFSGWSDGGAMQARAQRLLEPQRRLVLPDGGDTARARVLTEGAIGSALVARIDAAGRGDHVEIAAMFLSQRELLRALLDAARRGVNVRLLLPTRARNWLRLRSGRYPEPAGCLRTHLDQRRRHSRALVPHAWGALLSPWIRADPRTRPVPGLHGQDQSTLSRADLGDSDLAAAAVADRCRRTRRQHLRGRFGWLDALWCRPRLLRDRAVTTDADVYADVSQLRYWQYRLFEATGTVI